IARFIAEQGAVPGIQLSHAGRKASTDKPWKGGGPLATDQRGWQPEAPSGLPFAEGYPVPKELLLSELDVLEEQFRSAARRSLSAGFQVVEVHMAHGYLLHQFLSPLSNHRNDEYGGSFENRIRFPLRIVRAVREEWPSNLPLFVRLSVVDWVAGGWDLGQSVLLARRMKTIGVNLIDCSAGLVVPEENIPYGPGFLVPFSVGIRSAVAISTGAVGLITDPAQAEQIIATGQADVVFLARQMLRDPYWPLHAAKALGVEIPWPDQYLRAKKH
ncbi:MAG: oxidoreductase, partial [Geobacteraceae bacterium]|nr:oxidoreductase [Geobacteraceae bacterium]